MMAPRRTKDANNNEAKHRGRGQFQNCPRPRCFAPLFRLSGFDNRRMAFSVSTFGTNSKFWNNRPLSAASEDTGKLRSVACGPLRPATAQTDTRAALSLLPTYLFSTDLEANRGWVITQFAWRWSIEVLFKASKQILDIEAPQHW